MSDLLAIAGRFLAETGEKGEMEEKPTAATSHFSPFSPFSPPSTKRQTEPCLAGAEAWERDAAIGLMVDADSLIEELKLDGRLPAIRSAAAMVASAYSTRDMETVRFAVTQFIDLARGIAATGIYGRTQRSFFETKVAS